MQIAILGRQPEFGLAELSALRGDQGEVELLTPEVASFNGAPLAIERLGSVKKLGELLLTTSRAKLGAELRRYAEQTLIPQFAQQPTRQKVTLGLSGYGAGWTAKTVFNYGAALKKYFKAQNLSLRLVPNSEPELSTAQSHHNGLGSAEQKIELLLVAQSDRITLARQTGVQNPDAYAARDQARPKRDAFVGMLPPKLAQTMLNLATCGQYRCRLLDPFCGTGVILQEALLAGCTAYGSDLAPKMIDYSRVNLEWLQAGDFRLEVGDATTHRWQPPIDAVASELYLGSPLSQPPSFAKLQVLKRNAEALVEQFLANLAPQIESGTRLCLAIPAWRQANGHFTRLNLDFLSRLAYNEAGQSHDLLYAREQQIVARDIIVLVKK